MSSHFPIVFALKTNETTQKPVVKSTYKCSYCKKIIDKFKVKFKSDRSHWITKGIVKSSKKKQRLYQNFLNKWTPKNEETYKTFKNLFETIKKRSKKKLQSEKLQEFKGDARKTWGVMNEILGKCTTKSSTLPTKITVYITDIFYVKKNMWWIQ